MKENIVALFIIFVQILPYLTLLYKKVNIRIRLLFASLFQFSIFLILFFLIIKTETPVLLNNGYGFEAIFAISLIFNFLGIIITWIFEKWDSGLVSKNK